MKLIIVRHGDAQNSITDEDRALTEEGRRDILLMSWLIRATKWKFSKILCSPLLRTRQTAEIIAENIPGELTYQVEECLKCGFSPQQALELIEQSSKERLLNNTQSEAEIWVFHAPDVAHVASCLTGLNENSFYFPPGAVLALNLPPFQPEGRSLLIWKLQPEFIRTIFSDV